jgi:hypothetical protein
MTNPLRHDIFEVRGVIIKFLELWNIQSGKIKKKWKNMKPFFLKKGENKNTKKVNYFEILICRKYLGVIRVTALI